MTFFTAYNVLLEWTIQIRMLFRDATEPTMNALALTASDEILRLMVSHFIEQNKTKISQIRQPVICKKSSSTNKGFVTRSVLRSQNVYMNNVCLRKCDTDTQSTVIMI